MTSEYFDMIMDEPERFVDYILSDAQASSKIFDRESFARVFGQVLRSDPQLQFLDQQIKKEGESLEDAGKNIFEDKRIQSVIQRNKKFKTKELKKRIRTQRPQLRGKRFNNELDRRLKLSFSQFGRREIRNLSIEQATKPIRISFINKRTGKRVKFRRSAPRPLTREERILIKTGVKKYPTPEKVIQNYYESGFKFRTKESIRKHFYRIRNKK